MSAATRWLAFLFCVAAAVAAHGRGLDGEFLNFDDGLTVLANPAFRDGFPDGLARLLDPTERIADVYLPVSYLSLWVDWGLSGPAHPFGFHVHSVLLHAAAGFVLVLLLVDLALPVLAALAGAGLFLAHPATCESVIWISSRKDVLSGALALTALWLGRRACRGDGPAWPVALLVLLACYSKATVLVLPVMALGLWRIRQPDLRHGRFWKLWIAVTAVCAAAGVHHSFLALQAETATFDGRIDAVPGTFLHYLLRLVWPVDLAVHHPRALLDDLAGGAGGKTLFLGLVALAGVTALARGRGGLRLAGLGTLLVLAALLPFNGYKPAFAVAVADRYLYFALPAAGLVLAGALAALGPRIARVASVVALIGVGGGMLHAAWRRAPVFTRSDRLWAANLEVYPRDAVALINLGQWHLYDSGGGGVEDARPLLEKALEHASHPVHELRATVQLMQCGRAVGDYEAALPFARRIVELRDRLPDPGGRARVEARLQVADLLDQLGRRDDAGDVLGEVLDLAPNEPAALGRRAANVLAAAAAAAERLPLPAGDPRLREAKAWIDRARAVPGAAGNRQVAIARSEYHRLLGQSSRASAVLRRCAPHPDVHLQAARLFESEGLIDEAIRELERGRLRGGGSVPLVLRLGELYLLDGRLADAEALLGELHATLPRHAGVAAAYGRALIAVARGLVGRRPVADYAGLVAKARRLVPDHEHVPWLDALVLDAAGRPREALARVREARRRLPEHPLVRDLYLELLKKAGFGYLLAGDKAQAFPLFRELLDEAPDGRPVGSVLEVLRSEFDARDRAATDHLKAGRDGDAAADFRRALELFPDHEGALLKLGMALYAGAEHARALVPLAAAMQHAERRGGDPGMALLYRLRALSALGRDGEARDLARPYLAATDKIRDETLRNRIRDLVATLRR